MLGFVVCTLKLLQMGVSLGVRTDSVCVCAWNARARVCIYVICPKGYDFLSLARGQKRTQKW